MKTLRKLIVLPLAIFLFLSLTFVFQIKAQDSSLVLHLTFEEGTGTATYDQSGNGNHGTISGTSWVDGKYGKALSFDGDDYVNVGSASILDDLSELSYSLWVYPTVNADTILMDKLAAKYLWIDSTRHLRCDVEASITAAYATSIEIVTNDAWNYIVLTYSDSGDRKTHLYLNGIECTYNTQSVAEGLLTSDAAGDLGIATRLPAVSYPFHGVFDEVRVYNRTLTQDEITYLYTHGVETTSQTTTTETTEIITSVTTTLTTTNETSVTTTTTPTTSIIVSGTTTSTRTTETSIRTTTTPITSISTSLTSDTSIRTTTELLTSINTELATTLTSETSLSTSKTTSTTTSVCTLGTTTSTAISVVTYTFSWTTIGEAPREPVDTTIYEVLLIVGVIAAIALVFFYKSSLE